jgi:predicted nucleic acid-binding protein
MMKTVTSLFQSEQHAVAAVSHLEQAGIQKTRIDIWSTPHNLAPLLEDSGVSRSDAAAYVEGVIRGGTLIIVSCTDGEVGEAVRILDREGVLDLDEQQTSWRSEGWQEDAAADLAGSLEEASELGRGSPEIAVTSRVDQMSHGRIRIQPGQAKRPVQK